MRPLLIRIDKSWNPGDTDANPPKIDANYVENVAEGRCRAEGQKAQILRAG